MQFGVSIVADRGSVRDLRLARDRAPGCSRWTLDERRHRCLGVDCLCNIALVSSGTVNFRRRIRIHVQDSTIITGCQVLLDLRSRLSVNVESKLVVMLLKVLKQLPAFGIRFAQAVNEVTLRKREFLRDMGDVEILVMGDDDLAATLNSVA